MSETLDAAIGAETDLQKRLPLSLLLCRVVTAGIFAAYAFGTMKRPLMNADALEKVYYIPNMPSGIMIALGVIQMVIAIAVLLGVYKKMTRGVLVVLAFLTMVMPTYVIGYFTSTIGLAPHPAILYFTHFCLFACAFMIYRLRDHDTLASLNIGDA